MSRCLQCFQEWSSQPLSENPYQCSVTLMVNKHFLMFRRDNLPFSWCSLPIVLSLGTTETCLTPCSLHPSFRHLRTLMRSPSKILFSRLKYPSFLSLSSYERCPGHSPCLWPCAGLVPRNLCSCTGKPELSTVL